MRLLLTAQTHQLVVDLLRRFGPVGRLLIGGVGRLRSGLWWCRVRVAVRWGRLDRGSDRVWSRGLRLGFDRLRRGKCGWSPIVVSRVVESRCVRVGRRDAAGTRSEDEFGGFVTFACGEEHIAAGAVEQGAENLGGRRRSVVTEDAFLGHASGDLDSGET